MSTPRILSAPIVLLLALLAVVAGAIQLVAASERPRTQAAAPAGSKTDVGAIDGQWVVTMGSLTKRLTLVVIDTKVTGSLTAADVKVPRDVDKIEGEFRDGRLTFTATGEAMRRDGSDAGTVKITYEGHLGKNGVLSGVATLEGFDTEKPWSAVRAKNVARPPLRPEPS